MPPNRNLSKTGSPTKISGNIYIAPSSCGNAKSTVAIRTAGASVPDEMAIIIVFCDVNIPDVATVLSQFSCNIHITCGINSNRISHISSIPAASSGPQKFSRTGIFRYKDINIPCTQ